MLNLTDDATRAIQGLIGDRPGAGLRIFSHGRDSDGIHVGLAPSEQPEKSDEVVTQAGWRVFLDQQVAPLLEGRTLDATLTEGNTAQFAFLA